MQAVTPWGRWLRGNAEPRLPDLLRFVEAASTRLLDFVALFADPAALPCAAEAWRRLEAARRLTYEQPWAPAVLLALELSDYQQLPAHDDAWLAARLGLPEATVRICLALLADARQITLYRDRWRRVEVQSVDTRLPSRPSALKRWWTQVALDRIEAPDGARSFTICAVSQADFERIQLLQRAYYRDLRAIIAESNPSERVVLVNLHTVALDGV